MLSSTDVLVSSRSYVNYKLRDRCIQRCLFRQFSEGEHAFCDTRNSEANNNGNDAITNFSGNRDSRRRQINRVPNVQRCKCDGMLYSDI